MHWPINEITTTSHTKKILKTKIAYNNDKKIHQQLQPQLEIHPRFDSDWKIVEKLGESLSFPNLVAMLRSVTFLLSFECHM